MEWSGVDAANFGIAKGMCENAKHDVQAREKREEAAKRAKETYREQEDHVVALLRTKGEPVEQLVAKHIARSVPVQVRGHWYDMQVFWRGRSGGTGR